MTQTPEKICKRHGKPILHKYNSTLTPGCLLCVIEKQNEVKADVINRPVEKVAKKGFKSQNEGNGIKRERSSRKLEEKSQPELLKKAVAVFNLFIRNRDRLPNNTFYCPTCRKYKAVINYEGGGSNYNACHCFPAGKYSFLRFNEKNVWGGCVMCNKHQHGTNCEYNDWLRNKIGEKEYKLLLLDKDKTKKWEKFELIDLIKEYQEKNKQFVAQ